MSYYKIKDIPKEERPRERLLKVGADSAIIQIRPTKMEFEFVETNLNKLAQTNANKGK